MFAVVALALVSLLFAAAPAGAAVPGSLDQLGEPLECISETGSAGDCLDGRGLDGATALAYSPDGKHAYAVAAGSSAVSAFTREPATRALRQLAGTTGCVSDTGSGGACVDGRALAGAQDLAISPDGRFVYVAAPGRSAVTAFSRDAGTGQLTQVAGAGGCVAETAVEGCLDGRALLGAAALSIAPDGKQVYVAGLHANAIAVLQRNATTGTLSQVSTTAGCIRNAGGTGCATGRALGQPADVAVNSAGTRVYVAAQASDAVVALTRNLSTGALTQAAGSTSCVARTSVNGCSVGRALDGVAALTASPDGTRVFAASPVDDSLTAFSTGGGGVAQLAGAQGCRTQVTRTGCSSLRALDGPRSLAMTGDGRFLAVALSASDGVWTLYAGSGSVEWDRDFVEGAAFDGAASVAYAPDDTLGVASSVADALTQPGTGDPVACLSDGTSPACTEHPDLDDHAGGLTVPRDGKHAYQLIVDCERDTPCNNYVTYLVTYARSTTTGVLTPVPGRTGSWEDVLAVAASPDSRFLYVLHGTSYCEEGPCPQTMDVLRRNATTGALSVVAQTTVPDPVYGARLAITPDGNSLYAAGGNLDEARVVHFRRNTTTGTLVRPAGAAGCVNRTGADGCVAARLPSNGDLAVTNLGVFLVGTYDEGPAYGDGVSMLAALRRNTSTGALSQLAGAGGCVSEPAAHGCGPATGFGPAHFGGYDLAVSADSKHLYAGNDHTPAVVGFSYTSASGLRQLPGAGACVVPRNRTGCDGTGQGGSFSRVALAPDGRHLYAYWGSQISVFARNATSGVLAQLAGRDGCVSETGAGGCADGRELGGQLLVTADNRFVLTNRALFQRVR